MIHMIAAMALISITHTVCFAAMIERKYSIKKTAIIYALFCLSFVLLAILVVICSFRLRFWMPLWTR